MSLDNPRGSKQALSPGATIGILGGGQLGRMLALAGARLGLKTHIYATAALDVSQDRLVEKSFLRAQLGLDVAGFEDIGTVFDLRRAVKRLGLPCVLKTRRFGYDGKGQVIIRSAADIDAAWENLSPAPCILEAFVPFAREVSIVAARGVDGQIAAYPLTENVHENHILKTSTAPATQDDGSAARMAGQILEQLAPSRAGLLGMLCRATAL